MANRIVVELKQRARGDRQRVPYMYNIRYNLYYVMYM